MKPKYLVFMGQVVSKPNGEMQKVSADMLIKLYGVNKKECKIVPRDYNATMWEREHLQVLWARDDGNYSELTMH